MGPVNRMVARPDTIDICIKIALDTYPHSIINASCNTKYSHAEYERNRRERLMAMNSVKLNRQVDDRILMKYRRG